MGVGSPMFSAAEVSPFGTILAASGTSPYSGRVLWDDTSVLSAAVGEEAGGGDSLSIMFGPSEFPEEEDRWGRTLTGLQHTI